MKYQIGSLQNIGRISKQPGPNVTPNADQVVGRLFLTLPPAQQFLGGLASIFYHIIRFSVGLYQFVGKK